MSIYIIPAVVALLMKIGVYVLAKKSLASSIFLGLLAIFALHNAVEIVMVFAHHHGYVSALLLKFYYVVTVSILSYLCIFGMSVGSSNSNKVFNYAAVAFAFFLNLTKNFTNFQTLLNFLTSGALPYLIKYLKTGFDSLVKKPPFGSISALTAPL